MTARKRKPRFVETIEFRRFSEFCKACTQDRYIGLCHGLAGVGKTLSAWHFANWHRIGNLNLNVLTDEQVKKLGSPTTALYTAPVTNTPAVVERSLNNLRRHLERVAREPDQRKATHAFISLLEDSRGPDGRLQYFLRGALHQREVFETVDPTSLILIDEADRLTMQSLEQIRAIFDEADFGLVLIGMPGLEKKVARYAQLYSRVGFVHEFRSLNATEVTRIVKEPGWKPRGVKLPDLDEETVAAVIRVTSGNFRLIDRLLTQIGRLMKINEMDSVSPELVEAARDILVVGK